MGQHFKLGVSGRIAKRFQDAQITPLLALLGLLAGLFAILVTPREEEPQIDVTFANVIIGFPGASAEEVERIVATPAGQVLSELEGVKHVYGMSEPGRALVTVEFEVGEPRNDAIVRLYNQLYSNRDWLPEDLGVADPIIQPKGIDDVPIAALTLWSEESDLGGFELRQVAHAIEAELKRVSGTRDIYTIGGRQQVIGVRLQPHRMAAHNIAPSDLRRALLAANTSRLTDGLVRDDMALQLRAGQLLAEPEEVASLVVGVHGGNPVYLADVADVRQGAEIPQDYVRLGVGPAGDGPAEERPAVTIALAKQPGTNAVTIAERIIDQYEQLQGTFVPDGVKMTVTRNYGETANAKAVTLITKLALATGSVVLLVLIFLGWREAIIVGVAVVVTLAATLFVSWVWGFTLNRVSLFALIFAIGILVDDAIVVVENIHRHLSAGAQELTEAIPAAVDEVGGPTILATFTVIAALLPMAFVTGLMGPYMSPIPINASMGMLISLLVAFIVTPWLALKLIRHHAAAGATGEAVSPRLERVFELLVGPFLTGRFARLWRWLMLLALVVLILAAAALVGLNQVVLKMLPFDDKSEFQVVLDMPEGTSLERTAAVLDEMADQLAGVPEVTDYQIYAGTAAPINFNGLVRQYDLRDADHQGDIQVNLEPQKQRERRSHAIAQSVRGPLTAIAERYGGSVKIVEMPPGPPVQAPIVAEIYGIDEGLRHKALEEVRAAFSDVAGVVDVDDSRIREAKALSVQVDRARAARLGVSQETVVSALTMALAGEDVTWLHGGNVRYPVPVRLEYDPALKASVAELTSLRVRAENGALIPLMDLVEVKPSQREQPIWQKDLLPVSYVTGDMAGELDSPLYGMFQILWRLRDTSVEGQPLRQHLLGSPDRPYEPAIKWDGEWQITYETFRDMGIAYAVGLVLIYLLVVAQFRSYLAPLIIMVPIPLTVIGVMPGHWLMGAQFTATSMIGMIALAGIIVRNSILLVDFVNEQTRTGTPFRTAVIHSGAVRAKPIMLTGLAAMIGATFILDDPIFSGLAISLIFGIFVSTVLTLWVIPVMYYAFMQTRYGG